MTPANKPVPDSGLIPKYSARTLRGNDDVMRKRSNAKCFTKDGYFKTGEAIRVFSVRKGPAVATEATIACCRERLRGNPDALKATL